MVVLVTGGSGQLGQSLRSIVKNFPQIDFHFYESARLNISNKQNVGDVFKTVKPAFCINAAAYTAVDKAESDSENAFAINVEGVKNLAETCRDYGCTLIHISTDFVFDGQQHFPYSETDATNPKGVYGLTKLEGENEIRRILENYFIIRTSWLYSQFGHNFMKTMLRLANERSSLTVVNDQVGTPTHAVDLAEAIVKIILSKSNQFGIYNFSNEGKASWYDFARKIFELNNVAIDLKPIPTSEFPTPAKRPKYSVLDKSKIKAEFNIKIHTWEEALLKHK